MIRWTGSPSRRIALMTSSRPWATMSSRRSRENHCLILLVARWVATMSSQSRDGPPPEPPLAVKISTVSPEASLVSSGTSRPLTRAPMQAWPTSVWIA